MESFELMEWVQQTLPLSPLAASTLHRRYPKHFDVLPSWSMPGCFDVEARGVIGTVVLPDAQLVIRPKVELDVALYMLEAVLLKGGLPPVLHDDEASVSGTDIGLVVANWYAAAARRLLDRLVLRRYRTSTDAVQTVRGRVLTVESMRGSMRTAPPLLTCEFDEFTADTIENQVLLSAAHLLLQNPRLPHSTRAVLRRVVESLAETTLRVPGPDERRRIRLDRLSRPYAPALGIASWILDRMSPELGGHALERQFQTFLVQMHSVFETYVAESLRVSPRLSDCVVRAQMPVPVDDEKKLFTMNPDIVVHLADRRLVLDTKYKAFDLAYSPSQGDVYQLITYCLTTGARCGALVYPERTSGQVPRRYQIAGADLAISLIPVALGQGRAELNASMVELAQWIHHQLVAA